MYCVCISFINLKLANLKFSDVSRNFIRLFYTHKYAIFGVYDKGGVDMLRTNIELDKRLIDEALKLTHLRTKKELVNFALAELIRKMKRKKLLELEGKVEWKGSLEVMRRCRI